MNMTHKHVQTGSVYGLPSRDTMPQLTEAQAFKFGYRHAYQNHVAIYTGPHTDAFKSGCNHGQEARSLRLELDDAQLKVEDLTVQRDGLIAAIKALRVELDNWKGTAAQEGRNTQYYRGLLVQTGKQFGRAAYTSDDGSIQDDALVAKVPELVRAALDKARTAARLFTKGTHVLGRYNGFTGVVDEDQKPGASVLVRWDDCDTHSTFECAPDGLDRI